MRDKLDILNKIQQVEAPEFLFTRIKNSIDSEKNQFVNKRWILALAFCMSFVIAMNVFAFNLNDNASTQEDSYSLNTLNMLYNE